MLRQNTTNGKIDLDNLNNLKSLTNERILLNKTVIKLQPFSKNG